MGGGALTFRAAVECVAEWGFRFTRSPLILNMENRAKKQGRAIAAILEQTFGALLLTVDDCDASRGVAPSPAGLWGRVMCRGKLARKGMVLPPSLARIMFFQNYKFRGTDADTPEPTLAFAERDDDERPLRVQAVQFPALLCPGSLRTERAQGADEAVACGEAADVEITSTEAHGVQVVGRAAPADEVQRYGNGQVFGEIR